mgnify:FL=1
MPEERTYHVELVVRSDREVQHGLIALLEEWIEQQDPDRTQAVLQWD